MKPPKVAVVVLHYGAPEPTIRCAQSVLRASTFSQDICSTNIYIVDNGFQEQPLEVTEPILSSVKLLQTDQNIGFAAGMNIGIRAALSHQCDYLWLLNNDTEVDESALQALVSHARRHPKHKWIGCSIIEKQAGKKTKALLGYRYSAALSAAWPITRKNRHADYLDGAAMFLCAKTIKKLGGIPENNFLYFEELQLARAFHARQLSWGVCEDATVRHIQGSSTASMSPQVKSYHLTTAALTYTRQHASLFWPTVWTVRLIKAAIDSLTTLDTAPMKGFMRATAHQFFNPST